ncbi:acyltransferase 3 [Trichoderma velutinum]
MTKTKEEEYGVQWMSLLLLPSWLQPESTYRPTSIKNIHTTSYLDGLRGLISILVFVRHFSLPWQKHMDYGYGYDHYYGILRLPILRLMYAGPLVPMFFIVSGFVLSIKSFKLAQIAAHESLFLSLSKSTFRRAIRLFSPPIITTFFVMVLAQLGSFSFPYSDMPGRRPIHPVVEGSFWLQFLRWITFVTDELVNPWRWDIPRLEYGPHLWTIPISYKGSLVVFLLCLMLARVRPTVRLVMLCSQMVYAIMQRRWDIAPFLAGMVLSQLNLRHSADTFVQSKNTKKPLLSYIRDVLDFLLLLLGLYIGSFPRHNQGIDCVSGYRSLCAITPNYRYWHDVAAFTIIWALSQQTHLQAALSSATAQYFGKISFSMYLIHEPLLHVFGFFTVPFFWKFTGTDSIFHYQLGFGLGMIITAFVLIWLSDLFKTAVEDTCERLSTWVENACFTGLST